MSEGKPSYEGIVVLGVPRSGTTLMRRLLNAHPNICCPPETNLLRSCARFLHEEGISNGLSVGVLSGLAYSGFNEEDVVIRLREFAFGFLRESAAQAEKARWAEKTAFDVFYVDAIRQFLGDSCRFICILRNGFDVVCSLKELSDIQDRHLMEVHAYVRRYSSPYEAFAHAWVDCTQAMIHFAEERPDLCLTVRYEDLLANAEERLQEIFDFLGETADTRSVLGRAMTGGADIGLGDWKTYDKSTLDRSSVGRGRSLPEDVVARLAPIMNSTLALAGYPTAEVPEVPIGAEARDRYRAMKMVSQLKSRSAG
jgi:protein-tyrosine sulfotransferase